MAKMIVTEQLLSARPFLGLGTEADAYIFDDLNKSLGVNDADLALLARRTAALAPALARLFVEVQWFNPALDGRTFDWTLAPYRHLVRQLRLLQDVGTRVNLVLFQPLSPPEWRFLPLAEGMLELLAHLAESEGIRNVRWLTLYNEPDTLFLHESPLARRLFGERFSQRPEWDVYVKLNRATHDLLQRRGLYPHVRLLVPDTVWGHPIRRERMELAMKAFADLDVAWGYHNYDSEVPHAHDDNPDFAHPSIGQEATMYRELLGPERELVIWEFNVAGHGFGSHFSGVGPAGSEVMGTIGGATLLSAKVLDAAAHGVDGFCTWCLHDMYYCGSTGSGQMLFGLWRYKHQSWRPRPSYHYYGALCRAFRPGAALLRLRGRSPKIPALAARHPGGITVALLNPSARAVTVDLTWPTADPLTRRRLDPQLIPPMADLPFDHPEPFTGTQVTLAPQELSIISSGA